MVAQGTGRSTVTGVVTRPSRARVKGYRYSKEVRARLGELSKVEKLGRVVVKARRRGSRDRGEEREGQLMTIETPKATRPSSHQLTMFANSPASVFYDCGTSPMTSDHSLQTDLRFPSSPNSLTMYDGDADFHPSSFGSVCSNNSFVDTGQQPPNEDFDLKPQFECSDNAFIHQCLEMAADGASGGGLVGEDSIGGVPTEAGLMKMEDIFQVDQKDAIQGPTLAELNFDSDSLSVYDDVMERESEQQKQRLVSGGCTLWQQAILQGMDSTFNVPQVVCGGQKPPIKFTTCTVTSPTSTAVDMRMSTMETSKPSPVTTTGSHSTLPQSLYAVTAKLSLFSDSPSPGKVMSTDSMLGLTNNTSGGFLKIPPAAAATALPVQGGQNTLGVLGSLVPPHPQPSHQLVQPGALGGVKITSSANPTSGGGILPIAMDTEETKSSLQRLLTDPLPCMTIKSEPVDIPATTVPAAGTPAQHPLWHSAPAAVVIAGATPRAPMSPMSPPTSAISSMGLLGAGGLPTKSSIKRTRTPEMASSAPTGGKLASMEQKWEEIKQFIYDEEEAGLREEQAAGLLELQQVRHSGQQATSPQIRHHRQQQEQEQVALTPPKRIKVEQKDPAFTIKEEVDSGDEDNNNDSDAEDSEDGGESIVGHDPDDNSDADSDSQFSLLDENPGSSKGPPRYFWMYNTQSKGPKGKRLCKAVSTADPYTLGDFEDPVFDPELNQTQYKHNGKARRGDGNDITPSPQKLYALGNELKKLNSTINDLTPVSELPSGARSKSRKEKNKLASRACRLKKKAQHEANKVKLYGLEREHHDLLTVLTEIREKVFKMVRERNPGVKEDEALSPTLERLMKVHLTHMIAGHTADYVNSVLAKVVSGDPKGGLAL